MFYSEINPEAKKSHLQTLIKIAKVDKKLDDNEVRFIYDVGKQLGLDGTTIENLFNDHSLAKVSLPDSLNERMKYFYHILFLMGIDGNINEKEEKLCKKVAFRLCFNPNLIDDLIKLSVKGLKEKLPEKSMIETVIKYLN